MSRYDLLAALAGTWTVLLAAAVAVLVAWSAVGITRWLLGEIAHARQVIAQAPTVTSEGVRR